MTYPPPTCPNGHPVADARQRFCDTCGAPLGTGTYGAPPGTGTYGAPPPLPPRAAPAPARSQGSPAYRPPTGPPATPAATQRVRGQPPARAYPQSRRRQARRRSFNPMILVVVALVAVAGILGIVVLQLSQDGPPASSPGGIAGASGSPGTSARPSGSGASPAISGTPSETDGSPEPASPGTAPADTPADGTSPKPSPTAAALVRCTSQLNGFSIGYPKAWHTVEEDPAWGCMLFDRKPITVEPATEIPPVAVMISVIATPFDTVYAGITDPTFWEPVGKPVDTKVAGKPAKRLELVATGEGYDARGTLAYMFLFESDGNTYVLETHGPAMDDGTPDRQNAEYKANKVVLNSMVKSLKLT